RLEGAARRHAEAEGKRAFVSLWFFVLFRSVLSFPFCRMERRCSESRMVPRPYLPPCCESSSSSVFRLPSLPVLHPSPSSNPSMLTLLLLGH
ncbi:hypothetical protein C8F01DRAFT_1127378, partial [Mycena amicta]